MSEIEVFHMFEPVVGYRGWNLTVNLTLTGAYEGWTSAKMKSKHHGEWGRIGPHRSPHWDCLCGVNVYKTPLGARGYPIMGRVALTGEVIEFEKGYRGEYGEILELALDETYMPERKDLVARLHERYGVPVARYEYIPWDYEGMEEIRRQYGEKHG